MRRRIRERVPLALMALLPLIAALARSAPSPAFSAPYSGERVTEYEVELATGPHARRGFRIPAECPAAHQAFRAGAQQWCNRVERRLWAKVMQDCYYAAFLARARPGAQHDFVSGYDFMNARLADLPLRRHCGLDNGCEPLPPGVIDLGQILARVTTREEGEHATPEACRVEHGRFRGWVRFDPKGGMVCWSDPHANGFRIIAVDHGDVNGDGYLDAILRLIPLGRDYRRVPLILPLTRKRPDGPFSLPDRLAVP